MLPVLTASDPALEDRSLLVIVPSRIFAEVTALSRRLPVATASEPLVEDRSLLVIVPSRI
jgi:hypothetical protein